MAYEGFGQPRAFVCVFPLGPFAVVLTLKRKLMITDVWVFDTDLDTGGATQLSSNGTTANLATGGGAVAPGKFDRVPLVTGAKPILAAGSSIYARCPDLLSGTCKIVIEGRELA
jgi:hypothetical protein